MEWRTVAALVRGALPRRQQYSVCTAPGCRVIYFGEDGRELQASDVWTVPGFKDGGSDLACYCFDEPLAKIAREMSELGASPTLDSIRARVRSRECACDVRNPTGRCCLSEIGARLDEGASG